MIQRLIDELNNILNNNTPINSSDKAYLIDMFFSYRLLLSRNPDFKSELLYLADNNLTYRDFINNLLSSEEFSRNFAFLPAGKELMVEQQDIRFWFNSGDREMGVKMAVGEYEPQSVELIKKYCKKGMYCLDIGAQTGFYSLIFASIVKEQGKVFSFEPLESSYKLLLKNIKENHYENIVFPYNLACSDHEGSLKASKLANMIVIGESNTGEEINIKSIRIDDIINKKIDLVKIDVEGHEPAVIKGMKGCLLKYKPIIFSEINDYWLSKCSNYDAENYIKLLNSIGYDVFDVNNEKQPLIADKIKLGIIDTIDILAVPTDRIRKNIGK